MSPARTSPSRTSPAGVPSVLDLAGAALVATDLDDKVAAARALRTAWETGQAGLRPPSVVVAGAARGRPARPELVEPRQLRRRTLTTLAGRVAAVHAVAHIEANAIDLALDAVHRFTRAEGHESMPDEYVTDWLAVADDEARHFVLLRDRLRAMGADYGDLPAHGGLWAAAERTADDPLRRMALVPRVLEARGLDVSPGMIERFRAVGDEGTAAALEVILRDEVAHVAVGTRWFRWLCEQRGLDPDPTFLQLLADAGVRVAPPLNVEARRRAGFGAAELAALGG